jgi:hypothetical protein
MADVSLFGFLRDTANNPNKLEPIIQTAPGIGTAETLGVPFSVKRNGSLAKAPSNDPCLNSE